MFTPLTWTYFCYQQEPYKPKIGTYPSPDEQAQEPKMLCSSMPSLPMKAAKDPLKMAVALLPTCLQPLINHFGQKIITAHYK